MLKRAVHLLVGNVLVLLLVVAFVEIVGGAWVFGHSLGFLKIPRNVEIRHDLSHSVPGGGIALYSRDQYGFRGRYDTPANVDILAVGGSTTDELYVDDDKTWAEVLGTTLRKAGKDVQIANAGINGHSTIGHLTSMAYWFSGVPGLRPRFVLFYVGLNDVVTEAQAIHDDIRPQSSWARIRFAVRNNSALYSLFRLMRGSLQARRVRVVYGVERQPLRPIAPAAKLDRAGYAERLENYRGRLHLLARMTKEWGARPIFVTQRRGDAFVRGDGLIGTDPGAAVRRAVQALFNRVTMEVCRDAGGIRIDLGAEIALAPEDFSDNVHTLPSGSRKIGEYLATKLKDRL